MKWHPLLWCVISTFTESTLKILSTKLSSPLSYQSYSYFRQFQTLLLKLVTYCLLPNANSYIGNYWNYQRSSKFIFWPWSHPIIHSQRGSKYCHWSSDIFHQFRHSFPTSMKIHWPAISTDQILVSSWWITSRSSVILLSTCCSRLPLLSMTALSK